jgi:hypothetical protein
MQMQPWRKRKTQTVLYSSTSALLQHEAHVLGWRPNRTVTNRQLLLSTKLSYRSKRTSKNIPLIFTASMYCGLPPFWFSIQTEKREHVLRVICRETNSARGWSYRSVVLRS